MRKGLAIAALVAWMALIFWLSSFPSLAVSSQRSVDIPVRKILHVAAFGVLWWLWFAVTGRRLLSLLLTVLYGISDEWHQSMVPGRMGSWIDVGFDTLGALAAMYLSSAIDRFRRRHALDDDIPE